MSQKEFDRALFLHKVQNKQITLKKASELMHLSYPQTKRLWANYKKDGKRGLISKKRGRRSNRAVPEKERKAIAKIISGNYLDCKPLYISEKLEQYHNIKYSSEFIRQLMIEYKLWYPNRSKIQTHQRRQRRESEGELIQVDASDHDWFEGRAPKCHLHILIDDATSKIVGGYFDEEETTKGYYKAFLPFLEKNGRPVSIYNDKRGTFVINQGKKKGETQFSRAMKELGIKIIIAHSPQAKGRIERAFGTLQERLVWEMRINRIQTMEEANKFLPKFIEEYNNKFSKTPSNPFNAYRPLNQNMQLKYILCRKEKRTVSKNLEIQYGNKIYQLLEVENLKLKGAKITVITTLEGDIAIEHEGIQLKYTCYSEQPYKKPDVVIDELVKNRKNKPSSNHPWKRAWKVA